MSVTVSPIFLFDVEAGAAVAAELLDAITDKQLADYEAEWVPALQTALQRLNRANVAYARWPQSRHWDWRRKVAAFQGMLGRPGFSIVCNGVTQGMMYTDLVGRQCQIQRQKGRPFVYVDFVENAPWNRAELLFDPPKYRGVGSILIRAAIELSRHEEFKGRIGLHSLPQANDFYANTCGMTDMGPDETYHGLRYFEMTPEQAEAFCKKGDRT
ncbi:MAG: GNAT family N-acetyltransferase [Hyphomicrobiales bacterium]|nr:GNAT family N-acetyltransferase [Hyphomicrobiales bacterium]